MIDATQQEAYEARAVALGNLGRYKEALNDGKKLIQIAPDSAQVCLTSPPDRKPP